MILLVTDETGKIYMSLDSDPLLARRYCEPGQSLVAGCSVPLIDDERLVIQDGCIVQKSAADSLFDWGKADDLPGEGQRVEVIWTHDANYHEDPVPTAEGA